MKNTQKDFFLNIRQHPFDMCHEFKRFNQMFVSKICLERHRLQTTLKVFLWLCKNVKIIYIKFKREVDLLFGVLVNYIHFYTNLANVFLLSVSVVL